MFSTSFKNAQLLIKILRFKFQEIPRESADIGTFLVLFDKMRKASIHVHMSF